MATIVAGNNKTIGVNKAAPVPLLLNPNPDGSLPDDPAAISSAPANYQTQSVVGPLCATRWSQESSFNQYCPSKPNSGTVYAGRAPVGCVPVAMGQILYYWKPVTSKYNYNIMATNGSYSYNSPQMQETARLLSDIGSITGPMLMQVSIVPFNLTLNGSFADYGTSETNCNDAYVPWVFGAFGISSASRTESIFDQSLSGSNDGTSWAGLLTDELQNNKRPCMVGGNTDKSSGFGVGILPVPKGDGHEWVCDGSDVTKYYSGITYTYIKPNALPTLAEDGTTVWPTYTQTFYTPPYIYSLLHMNWGWGPYSLGGANNDGWYNCNINYTTVPDGRNFQYFQTVIHNIHP